MHHFFESITNTRGESLVGYFARVIDPATQAVVPIASDGNGTPIVTVSGVANMAKTDEAGNLSFFVEPGTYHLDIYQRDASTFLKRVPNLPMNSQKGDKGDPGDQGDPGPADNTYTSLAAFKASEVARKVASLVGAPGVPDGRFNWTLGNFTGRADDINTIKADSTALSVGAWVRQNLDSIARRTVPELLASAEGPRGAGAKWYAEEFSYTEAAADASDQHLTTTGGVKLYVNPTGTSARQWAIYPDTGEDLADRFLVALANHPGVFELEAGVYLTSKGLRQVLNGSVLRGAGRGKTFIRNISPTGNGNNADSNPNGAMVWALGNEGAPIYGLRTEDLTLDCAGLSGNLTGPDSKYKGHHYRRVQGFEVNRVEVLDCGSYAFWANDKIIEAGGTITGCSGVYNDCIAKDAEIFFETTGRCFVTYNRPRAEQTRNSWAWPVQDTYHFYSGDGLITVNDGYAKVKSSTVIGPLLTQKNVIWNGGYYEQLDPLTTVINMGTPTGNYDGWAFNDVDMVAAGAIGAISFGGASGPDNKMTISGGKWVAREGVGPTFTATAEGWGSIDIVGLDCVATTSGGAVPFSLIQTGTFKNFNVFGGNQEAFGPSAASTPVNAPAVKFLNSNMTPSTGAVVPAIRQMKQGSIVVPDGGGFGQINFFMPLNTIDVTKVAVTATIRTTAGTNVTGANEGVSVTWNNPADNIVNILLPASAIGKIVSYSVTEFE